MIASVHINVAYYRKDLLDACYVWLTLTVCPSSQAAPTCARQRGGRAAAGDGWMAMSADGDARGSRRGQRRRAWRRRRQRTTGDGALDEGDEIRGDADSPRIPPTPVCVWPAHGHAAGLFTRCPAASTNPTNTNRTNPIQNKYKTDTGPQLPKGGAGVTPRHLH